MTCPTFRILAASPVYRDDFFLPAPAGMPEPFSAKTGDEITADVVDPTIQDRNNVRRAADGDDSAPRAEEACWRAIFSRRLDIEAKPSDDATTKHNVVARIPTRRLLLLILVVVMVFLDENKGLLALTKVSLFVAAECVRNHGEEMIQRLGPLARRSGFNRF
jgi:hypothetical protein